MGANTFILLLIKKENAKKEGKEGKEEHKESIALFIVGASAGQGK